MFIFHDYPADTDSLHLAHRGINPENILYTRVVAKYKRIKKHLHLVTIFVTFVENIRSMKRVFKIHEIIKILESQGWYLARHKGTSHRQFKHPSIRRTITVDGKPSDDVSIDNLKSMEKQSGLKFKDFVE